MKSIEEVMVHAFEVKVSKVTVYASQGTKFQIVALWVKVLDLLINPFEVTTFGIVAL